MRRLLSILVLGAAALATPALALTISPSPTRDQAPHLKQERGTTDSTDLRDTYAAGGRPIEGSSRYSSGGSYGQTQTYSFGSVTTTITTERSDFGRSDFGTRDYRPGFGSSSTFDAPPPYLPRRR
jgi:hypothetical protein